MFSGEDSLGCVALEAKQGREDNSCQNGFTYPDFIHGLAQKQDVTGARISEIWSVSEK